MKRIVISVLFALLLPAAVLSAQSGLDYDQVLRDLDNLGNFDDVDFTADYTFVTERPGEETSIYEVKLYRRDSEEKFMSLVLQPEVDMGSGMLKSGDNVWMYDPISRKFNHTSLKENFQDSEAKNSDFEASSLEEDYHVVAEEEARLGRYETWILTLEANHDEVTYPKQRIWVRKDNLLPLKIEDYSLSDRLMRTVYYPAYTRLAGDRFMPTQMLIVNNLKEGDKTQITIRNYTLTDIPDNVFTKSYLERINN